MKKRALRKDFYMEIRRTFNRFISIFLIVALGVAFYSGIQASAPDMEASGDAYFDNYGLMDLKVVGTLGLTDDDVESLSALESIEKAEGAYMTDVLYGTAESQQVLHVESLTEEFQSLQVLEGSLPENPGECFLDESFALSQGIQVGDEITISEDVENEEDGVLKNHTYTVSGIGASPVYISFNRGNTTLGSGQVEGFLYVLPEDFDMEVYTQIFLEVAGAAKEAAFSDEYESLIDQAIEEVEGIAGERCDVRYQEVTDEANQKIADAEAELEDGRAEAQQKIDDAKQEIADGEQELEDGRAEVEDGRAQIEDAKAELEDGRAELENSRAELESNRQTLEDSKAQLSSGWQQLEDGKAQFAQAESEYNAQAASANQEISDGESQIASAKQELNKGQQEYEQGLADIEAALRDIDDQLAAAELEIANGGENRDQVAAQYEETITQLTAARTQLVAQKEALADTKAELDAGWAEVEANEEKLSAAKQELSDGAAQIEAARSELASQEAALASAQAQVDEGEQQLNNGYAQLEEGEQELADAEAEIETSESELADAEATIAENEQKLEDAKADLAEGEQEMEDEIADGEQKIQDAKDELAEIKEPEWTVSQRMDDSDYSGYGDNADRMRNIGKVFPALFFLVAALISLTTMTRMVEEERTQIGTLKALGYGKISIMGKYVAYALFATLGGSIVGVLFGEKVLPYVIIEAYGIMYPYMDSMVLDYQWDFAAIATALSVLCTMAATLSACYRELQSTPASLMRPPSPKEGKRVLLEYIPFIWKHLSFTWKSTVRNLFRYKKRFLMTIFGIGGCMALLLVGFGLRDSIVDIAVLQYDQIQTYDGILVLDEDAAEEERASLLTELQENDQVTDFQEVYMKNLTMESVEASCDIYLMVPETTENFSAFVTMRDRQSHETYELGDDGIVLTEKAATILDVSVGDTISITLEEGNTQEVTISDICENYMYHYAYMSAALFEKTFGQAPDYENVLFITNGENEAEIERIGESFLRNDAALSISYMSSIEDQVNDMLGSLDIVIVVLIISAGMLALVVLYNLNNINVNERKRELATLKVLGFYDKEVSAYMYRENILLTLIGAAVGSGLGIVLHRFTILTVEIDMCMFGRVIKPMSFVISILFTCAFSVIVNVFMHFKLKKIDMVESLKSVE